MQPAFAVVVLAGEAQRLVFAALRCLQLAPSAVLALPLQRAILVGEGFGRAERVSVKPQYPSARLGEAVAASAIATRQWGVGLVGVVDVAATQPRLNFSRQPQTVPEKASCIAKLQ